MRASSALRASTACGDGRPNQASSVTVQCVGKPKQVPVPLDEISGDFEGHDPQQHRLQRLLHPPRQWARRHARPRLQPGKPIRPAGMSGGCAAPDSCKAGVW
jgi:hypothetical protein